MPARIRPSPLATASLADLPVLPFLAPRLLQPWPSHTRRASSNDAKETQHKHDGASETRYRGVLHADRRLKQSQTSRCLLTSAPSRPSSFGYRSSCCSLRDGRARYSTMSSENGLLEYMSARIDSEPVRARKMKTTPTRIAVRGADDGYYPRNIQKNIEDSGTIVGPASDIRSPFCTLTDIQRDQLESRPDFKRAYDFMLGERERVAKLDEHTTYFTRHWDDWVKWEIGLASNDGPNRSWDWNQSRLNFLTAAINQDTTISALRDMWLVFKPGTRYGWWPLAALHVLKEAPDCGLKFVVATLEEPLAMRKQISDVLDFLFNHHLSKTSSPLSTLDFKTFFNAIVDILQRFTGSQVSISDFAVYKLYKHANREQAERLHSVLMQRGKRLHINARLFAVERLAKLGATDAAMEVLGTLRRDGVKFKSPEVESVCATLLRNSQCDAIARYHENDISSYLIQSGITPRVNFYNILMHNAIESGDPETAWKVYDMMLHYGVTPSTHTYSILLNDAKWRLDVAALSRIVTDVQDRDIRNEYIANDMVHAMYLMHEKRSEQLWSLEKEEADLKLWNRMLRLYAQYFAPGPLSDFSSAVFCFDMVELDASHASSAGKKMHPDYPTLYMMLSAALKLRVKDRSTVGWYNKYKKLVQDGHPDFVRLAKHTCLSDVFIHRLGQHSTTLPHCMTVLADMLGAQTPKKPPKHKKAIAQNTGELVEMAVASETTSEPSSVVSEAAESPESETEPPPNPTFPPPSLRTWNLLLSAFMAQSQPLAAEKVLSMMTAKGHTPTSHTWSSLIFGYARLKNEEGLVSALVRSERAGVKVGQQAWKGVGGVRRQSWVMGRVLQKLGEERDGEEDVRENEDGVKDRRFW